MLPTKVKSKGNYRVLIKI